MDALHLHDEGITISISTGKKRVALVLLGPHYIRSWVDTGLLRALLDTEELEIAVFAPQHVVDRWVDADQYETSIIESIEPTRAATNLVALSWVALRSRSSTFRFALERNFLSDYRLFPFRIGMKKGLIQFLRNIRTIAVNTKAKRKTVLYFFPLFRVLSQRNRQKLENGHRLPPRIANGNFDWLVVPCNALDELMTDYLAHTKQIGLRSLLAIDNWDNLTSKSAFVVQPDVVTVMGAKCVQYAAEIHRSDPKTVLPIGLPRFDVYRSLKKNGGTAKSSSMKRVLYAGFSLAHSEKRVVDALASYLDSKYGPGVVEIHYRPHPLAVPRIDDYEIKNPHVVVTEHGNMLRTGLPHMDDEFINALTEADVVVGAPTTLMLEAMLIGRPCVLDITSDKYHRTTAGNAARRYTHMRDLLAVRELARGETHEQLIIEVNRVLESGVVSMDYGIHHLYDTTAASYVEQLKSVLLARPTSNI
jgi:hypothetical protein